MLDRKKRPELSQFPLLNFDFPSYQLLPNGIKLYVIDGGDQDVTKLEVLYRGGQFDEEKPMQSALLTSMLSMGTTAKTSAQISEQFDYYGSWFSSRSQDNYTHSTLHSLNKYFDKSFSLFLELVKEPSFPTSELELLKTQFKGAYHTAREQVKYLASVAANTAFLGPNHPLAYDARDEDIDAVSANNLTSFHQKFYRPENCTLIISGKIEDSMIQNITENLGLESASQAAIDLRSPEETRAQSRLSIVDKPGALQSAISMMLEAIPRSHPDYIKLRILATVLGGYFGSRLMSNIREDKGYTYGINAALMGRRKSAYISIGCECATHYTQPLIAEIRHEMQRLQNDLIEVDELNVVKNFMLSDLAKSIETPFLKASIIHSKLFFGIDNNYFNNQVDQIINITPHDLREIAEKYLNFDKIYTIIAGDKTRMKLGQ